jgi:cell division septum initiation protein DivIVA
MPPDAKRLMRLHRLERVRAIAKQTAATAAAEAEGTLAQLQALAARTGSLADDYAGRNDARDGMTLQQIGRFAGGLRGISENTQADALRAKTIADSRQQELAAAERRRAAVEERAIQEAKDITARRKTPVLGRRKAIGTDLE